MQFGPELGAIHFQILKADPPNSISCLEIISRYSVVAVNKVLLVNVQINRVHSRLSRCHLVSRPPVDRYVQCFFSFSSAARF